MGCNQVSFPQLQIASRLQLTQTWVLPYYITCARLFKSYYKYPELDSTQPKHNRNFLAQSALSSTGRNTLIYGSETEDLIVLSTDSMLARLSTRLRGSLTNLKDVRHQKIGRDNATTFLSEEFQAWCRQRGITHLTGAPYHPATNGAAERLVQSFKESLRKSTLSPKAALQDFLLQYRRTPLDSGYSPSELLNGRQIRCKLDALFPSQAEKPPSLSGWSLGNQCLGWCISMKWVHLVTLDIADLNATGSHGGSPQ